MERKLWEKVLKIIPDSELIHLIKETKIPIPPGFRAESLHRNINMVRPMLIKTILKDISFLKSITYFEIKIMNNENYAQIRGKNQKEIQNYLEKEENPYLFIISLLTSKDENDRLNGEYFLNEYEKQVHKQTTNEKNIIVEKVKNTHVKKIEELQRELEKKNKKINQLEQNLANLKNSFNQESAKWEKEKKKLQTEYNEIKKENREKDVLIQQLKQELEQMEETLSSIKKERSSNSITEQKVKVEPVNQEEIKLAKVALIGKEVSLPMLNQYDVTVIPANEIDQFTNPDDFYEIWILTFELTRLQLFKLRTKLQTKKMVEFDTIHELEKYIYQERRALSWQANGTFF